MTDVQVDVKLVYRFREGNATMRDLLGGKGANLCEMARLGLPVPPGFVITTDAFREYYASGREFPAGLWETVQSHVHEIEDATGRKFGDPANPLLVSVRSGSKFSMPGMMDTILNLGLNDDTVEGLARVTDNPRFAMDSYRRFVQMFSKVAMNLPGEPFEDVLTDAKTSAGVKTDADLNESQMEAVARRFLQIASDAAGSFPQDPWAQLRIAIRAVFESWENERAIAYRNYHGIPHDVGTACNILAMVFGNTGPDSGTGVCFSRNTNTGEPGIWGEYLENAQGEDVVAGVRTPKEISQLRTEMPEAYEELNAHTMNLEKHFKDVQDVEFTIENKRLYILQTRSAKRTAAAAVKTAVDMEREGLISRDEAIQRVPAADLFQLLLPVFDKDAKKKAEEEGRLIGKGLNASPGAATGRAVFESAAAVEMGESSILVRPETSADDMPGILRTAAVLTSRGGSSSHAAVVTRGLGKPAVVGASDITVDTHTGQLSANGTVVRQGDAISIDGFTGEVFVGAIETVEPDVSGNEEFQTLLRWADEARRLGVRANADTPGDAAKAREYGAKGIGLCRTEHMFFQEERLPFVRQMLMEGREVASLQTKLEAVKDTAEAKPQDEMAQTELRVIETGLAASQRAYSEALTNLESFQTADFAGILEAMDGLPVVIRLLDAPLHEFLPPIQELIAETSAARAKGSPDTEKEALLADARTLQEMNPMLGHRGSRLGLTYPGVYEMQVRAIVAATKQLREKGKDPRAEIMVPLIVAETEMKTLRERLTAVAAEMGETLGKPEPIHFGTMIETPRAALTASDIARHSDFFSFGSNDMTQMAFGFSRDDAEEKFLNIYVLDGLLPKNPFETLDEQGVGRLVRMAVDEGRESNPDLELGLCGEHGGDPESIDFCHRAGLDYVSCSPPRVPTARLAAAQAALGSKERDV
jgi:pyruvate, orthophosphate dikinase